ncbi:hypothetical protein [Paenibacillus sinopodophylli]|uniref:hypothetical protein n=1 Tax=Paenibacillus sinopodophylli TaxID=1837342 RepID=UPI00110D15B0|nr:hypothetical protein [Paenibacillus sinopodophylli]
MLRTISTLLALRTSITANLLIYYIQKLPIIGKLVKNSLYANLDLKKGVAIIALLLTQLWGFLLRFVYVGLLIFIPVMGLGEDAAEEYRLSQFIHMFTMISFVVAAVSGATVLEPKREKYLAVKMMRLSPKRYMQASLGYRYVTFGVYLLPAMLVFGTLLGASVLEMFLLTLLITLWRIIAEYGHLKLFEKTGMVLIKQTAIVWSVIIIGYAAAYLPLLLGKVLSTNSILMSLPVCIVIIAGGLFAAIQLARYSKYRETVDVASKRDDPLLNLGQMMNDAQKKSVRSKDSDNDLSLNHKHKMERKEGHAYLNAIFFIRHRSLIIGPMNKRLMIIGAVGVAGVILMLLSHGQLFGMQWSLGMIFPFLPLIMYFMSTGENLCKAMFYNCDLSLMRYSFYRSAAYQHFLIRLRRMLSLNLLVAAALGVSLTAVTAAAGGEWLSRELLLFWICVIAMAIFYTVHHLFMYYILQPYSTELNMKNPLYFVLSMAVSSMSGVSIVLRPQADSFTVITVAAALVYVLVSIVLVKKYGSRTFRVK